ncbi:hypothetical protein Tco_0828163 [Tanacetum coccineum]
MLNFLKINANLFTCDTPLGRIFDEFSRLSGMDDDLFAYKVEIPEPSRAQSVEQQYDDLKNSDLEIFAPQKCYEEYERMFAEAMILINGKLIRLIDVTIEQWPDLKFGDHRKVNKEVMESDDEEEVLTNEELSDLEEENLDEENEIAEIFRI